MNKGQKSQKEIAEELAYIKSQINSLAMRGHYSECIKMIDSNIGYIYKHERWPEAITGLLKTYARCFPTLNRSETFEEYILDILDKNAVPKVFIKYINRSDFSWSSAVLREVCIKAKEEKELEDALDYVDIAIKVDPANSNHFLLKAWVLEDMGRNSEAFKMYENALELNSTNYKATEGIIKYYLSIKDYSAAVKYADRALEKNENEPDIIMLKADILSEMEQYENAVELYDKLIDMKPYNADYVCKKALCILASGNEVKAITFLRQALALNEKHEPVLEKLTVLLSDKKPLAALTYAASLAALNPEEVKYAFYRADLLLKTGSFEMAAKEYKKLLQKVPDSARANGGLAFSVLKDEPQRAVRYFNHACELEPDNAAYYFGRAEAYFALDNCAEAIRDYKKVTGLNKSSDKSYYKLGCLHQDIDFKLAVDYFNKAISINDKNPNYLAGKAAALLNMGESETALDILDIAVRMDPGNAQLHYTIGRELQKTGSRASALLHYRHAVNIYPGLSGAHFRIAELLMYSDPDTALLHINSAIGLDVANPRQYYLKSLIICEITENERVLDKMLENYEYGEDDANEYGEDSKSLRQILAGEGFSVALKTIDRAIQLKPAENEFLCFRAQLYFRLGHMKKAVEDYEKILKTDKASAEALFGLGQIYAESNAEKALKYIDKAIAINEEGARYYTLKGCILAEDGHSLDESIACFDRAIALDKLEYTPLLYKARLLDKHGDIFKAVENYRRAILINPNCEEALLSIITILLDIKPMHSIGYIAHLAKLYPARFLPHVLMAKAHFKTGSTRPAEEETARALELAEESAQCYYSIAKLLKGVNNALAYESAVKAAEAEPENPIYMLALSEMYTENKDYENAYSCLKKITEADKDNIMAYYKKAEILYIQKDISALKQLDEVLLRDKSNVKALMLKALVLEKTASPPDYKGALKAAEAAVKAARLDIDVREKYAGLLLKNNLLIKYAVEKAKLRQLKLQDKKARQEIQNTPEIDFKMFEEPEQ